MMRIAIMQPYLFPYIGYFQLINAVDKFVILDDVNYINKGWINRNRILVNNIEFTFTIPLQDASQNKLIKDCDIVPNEKWKIKLLKTIELAYKKSPYYTNVFPIITLILNSKEHNISTFIYNHLLIINNFIGINTEIIKTSIAYNNLNLKAQDKILDICLQEKANQYINPIGGIELYSKEDFNKQSIELSFLKSSPIEYKQYGSTFVPWLSIIDVLMFNSIEDIKSMLPKYKLQ